MGILDSFMEKVMSIGRSEDQDDFDMGYNYEAIDNNDYNAGSVAIAPMRRYSETEESFGTAKAQKKESRRNQKITPIKSGNKAGNNVQVRVIKPAHMDDAQDIADLLLSGSIVFINFTGVDGSLLRDITSFVSGVIYSIDGSLERISSSVLIAAPAGVAVEGDMHEAIGRSSDAPFFKSKL